MSANAGTSKALARSGRLTRAGLGAQQRLAAESMAQVQERATGLDEGPSIQTSNAWQTSTGSSAAQNYRGVSRTSGQSRTTDTLRAVGLPRTASSARGGGCCGGYAPGVATPALEAVMTSCAWSHALSLDSRRTGCVFIVPSATYRFSAISVVGYAPGD